MGAKSASALWRRLCDFTLENRVQVFRVRFDCMLLNFTIPRKARYLAPALGNCAVFPSAPHIALFPRCLKPYAPIPRIPKPLLRALRALYCAWRSQLSPSGATQTTSLSSIPFSPGAANSRSSPFTRPPPYAFLFLLFTRRSQPPRFFNRPHNSSSFQSQLATTNYNLSLVSYF